MIIKTPTHHFLVSGCSEGPTPLNSFDAALLASGVGDANLVKMTSIVPPGSIEMEPVPLPPGALVPVAYAAITSDLKGEMIAAAVAIATPTDPARASLIMEYSARGHREEAEEIVRNMAADGLAHRGLEVKSLRSISTETKVSRIATAFAGVVLWEA